MELGPIFRALQSNKPRFGVTVIHMAATLAILANSMTLLFDARAKMELSIGFDEEHLVSGTITCPLPNPKEKECDAWRQTTMAELRQVSGVESLSISSFKPFFCQFRGGFRVPNTTELFHFGGECLVDEALPATLGLDIEEGRWFSREEVEQWAPVVVVDRDFGRSILGDKPLVGQSLGIFSDTNVRIIGVLHDPRITGGAAFSDAGEHNDNRCVIYNPGRYLGGFVARLEQGKAAEVRLRMTQMLWSRNASPSVMTFAETRQQALGHFRALVMVMGGLAGLLLLLAALGIAGLASFSVTERTRQIGVRRALGATKADILRYFLTEIGIVASIAMAAGAGLSVPLNLVILRLYAGAKLDPTIVVACALLLFLVALAAALPPALRASRISPAIATRNV